MEFVEPDECRVSLDPNIDQDAAFPNLLTVIDVTSMIQHQKR